MPLEPAPAHHALDEGDRPRSRRLASRRVKEVVERDGRRCGARRRASGKATAPSRQGAVERISLVTETTLRRSFEPAPAITHWMKEIGLGLDDSLGARFLEGSSSSAMAARAERATPRRRR